MGSLQQKECENKLWFIRNSGETDIRSQNWNSWKVCIEHSEDQATIFLMTGIKCK